MTHIQPREGMGGRLPACPFCGAGKVGADYFCGWAIYCQVCEASGPSVEGPRTDENRRKAEDAWRKRAANPQALTERLLSLAADISDVAEDVRSLATPHRRNQ